MKGVDGNEYRRRKLKRRTIFEVLIEGKWKSTGEESLEAAIGWVERREGREKERKIKELCEGCYRPGGVLRERMERRNKERSTGYWLQQQSRLERYILPYFGNLRASQVTARMVDEWLLSLELSGNTKNKLLYSMKSIMAEAVRRGMIERSPCEAIESFGERTKEREVFSEEELERLFPAGWDGIEAVWGDAMWGAYFLCLADCGHRPGEQSVLEWGDLWEHEGRSGFIVDKAMDGVTYKAKGTTKTGYSRSSLLSARARAALEIWRGRAVLVGEKDLIFSLDGRRGLIGNTINKHLRASALRAGVDLRGRTAYCFRHTFNTMGLLKHKASDVKFLMGHRSEKETDHYNHPDRRLLIRKALQIKEEK